jgi:hypothetical protein
MEQTAYTIAEQFLSIAGLAYQSNIMAYLRTNINSIGGLLILVGMVISLLQAYHAGDHRPFVAYILTALAFMLLIKWEQGVSVVYHNSSDSNAAALSSQFKDLAKGSLYNGATGGNGGDAGSNANGLFVLGNGVIDILVKKATEAVQQAATGDKLVMTTAALTSAVSKTILSQVDDPNVKQAMNAFYDPDTGVAPTIQKCLYRMGKDAANQSAGMVTDMMNYVVRGRDETTVDGLKKLDSFYSTCATKYQDNPVMQAQIETAKNLPTTLKRTLDAVWDDKIQKELGPLSGLNPLNWAEIIRLKSALAQSGDNFELNNTLRAEWINQQLKTQSPETSPNLTPGFGKDANLGTLGDILAKFVVWWDGWYGKIKANAYVTMFPYFQGYALASLFSLFPFFLLLGLWPGGWKATVKFFGLLLWVKSWTFFACLVANVTDFITKLEAQAHSLSLNYQGFSMTDMTSSITPWFSSVLMFSIPLVSYAVLFGGAKDFMSLDFRPRGLDAVATVAKAAAFSAVRSTMGKIGGR